MNKAISFSPGGLEVRYTLLVKLAVIMLIRRQHCDYKCDFR